MSHAEPTRRQVLKLLTAAPLVASRGLSAAQRAPATTVKRTSLCLVSRHLQWTNVEEAAAVAAEAGCKAISWTVRAGAHILPANVERDLPKAVEVAHKAGLDTPMVITALNEGASERAEAILDTMRGLGIRYYRAAPFRYDYSGDLAQQIDALKPRIASLIRLNEKYGTTAMYHTHSAYGLIGGGVWDLWMAVKDFDPQFVGLNYDLGHATIRGGTGWMETSHLAHKFVHGLSVKDFRWVKSSTSTTAPNTGGGRRGGGPPADGAPRAPWAPEMVPGGEGMVDFNGMMSYFKSVGFGGPVELYQEYYVTVPGVAEPVNMLGTDYGKWQLEMPKSNYIALLRRDVDFYSKALTESGLL
jgi:sugar phosphate isomerase/epimerase